MHTSTHSTPTRYVAPNGFVTNLFNPIVKHLITWGIDIRGGHILEVAGRTSGNTQHVPVNPLDLNGERYLVAPRGNTHWVRNLRAAGSASLRHGRATINITATEVADNNKAPIFRAYLERWSAETGEFFDDFTSTSPDEAAAPIANGIPVFHITTDTPAT